MYLTADGGVPANWMPPLASRLPAIVPPSAHGEYNAVARRNLRLEDAGIRMRIAISVAGISVIIRSAS